MNNNKLPNNKPFFEKYDYLYTGPSTKYIAKLTFSIFIVYAILQAVVLEVGCLFYKKKARKLYQLYADEKKATSSKERFDNEELSRNFAKEKKNLSEELEWLQKTLTTSFMSFRSTPSFTEFKAPEEDNG